MFNIHDWDSIYEYFFEQAMNEVTDEDYAHAYGKSQADLVYISEWRSKWAERRKYDKRAEKKTIEGQHSDNGYFYNVYMYGYDNND